MREYAIPVRWEMTATMYVEAESLEDAVNEVLEGEGLPRGRYADDSFMVDESAISQINALSDKKDIDFANTL